MPLVPPVDHHAAFRCAHPGAIARAGTGARAVDSPAESPRVVTAQRPAAVPPGLGRPDLNGTDAPVMTGAVSGVPVVVAIARRAENALVRLLDADDVTQRFPAVRVPARVAAMPRALRGGGWRPAGAA
jgi:hypothetical protein